MQSREAVQIKWIAKVKERSRVPAENRLLELKTNDQQYL